MRTWSGAGVSVLVCTRGAAIEMDSWWFGMFQFSSQSKAFFNIAFGLFSKVNHI